MCLWHGDFTRWHPKWRLCGHRCLGRRSWRTGSCPLVPTSTLSTSCISFPKVVRVLVTISYKVGKMYCVWVLTFFSSSKLLINNLYLNLYLYLRPYFATSDHEGRLQKEFQLEMGLLGGYKRVSAELRIFLEHFEIKNTKWSPEDECKTFFLLRLHFNILPRLFCLEVNNFFSITH